MIFHKMSIIKDIERQSVGDLFMIKKRGIMLIGIALLLILGMVGCGKNNETDKGTLVYMEGKI